MNPSSASSSSASSSLYSAFQLEKLGLPASYTIVGLDMFDNPIFGEAVIGKATVSSDERDELIKKLTSLREKAIKTLQIDPWIEALTKLYPTTGPHSFVDNVGLTNNLNTQIYRMLLQLYISAPFGQGPLILLQSLEKAKWDPANYHAVYNLLIRVCTSMGDIKTVDKISTLMEPHLLDRESVDSLDKINYNKKISAQCNDNEGKRVMPDGSIHEGTFRFDVLSGFGRITQTNGNIDQGEYFNGRLNGCGIVTRPDFLLVAHFTNGCLLDGEKLYPDGTLIKLGD